MNLTDLIGAHCRDRISGNEGVATAMTFHVDGSLSVRVEMLGRRDEWISMGRLTFSEQRAMPAPAFDRFEDYLNQPVGA